jgi:hypothetical protein
VSGRPSCELQADSNRTEATTMGRSVGKLIMIGPAVLD